MKAEQIKKLKAYEKIITTARQKASKASQEQREANEKMRKHEITRNEDIEIYQKTETTIKLYNLAKNAACDAFIDYASNCLIEEMKENKTKYTNIPLHYKKFENLINTFFAGSEPTKDNHVYKFSITTGCTGVRIELHNYFLEFNYSDSQLFYLDKSGEGLTDKDIEEATTREIIDPNDIIKECKKALKDADKIRQEYEKMQKKLNNYKKERTSNTAIYNILPDIPYLSR